MRDLHSELTQSDLTTTSVQSMWDKFATKLEQGIDKFIPSRKSSTQDGFLWINQEIRHLNKLYKHWSRSGRPYDQSKFLAQALQIGLKRHCSLKEGFSNSFNGSRKSKCLKRPISVSVQLRNPHNCKTLAQKSLQDLHDSGANHPFQPGPHPKNA